MANVKVAVRVRPPTAKESVHGGRLAVQVEDKYVRVRNVKLDGRADGAVDSREKLLEFGFDYCYWSVDAQDPQYASQEEVFQDLGVSVLAGASEGYNVCLFAYGQTGSGKTYTMMGSRDSVGLTPRICEGLFSSVDSFPDGQNSSRVEISFLEIYNERVRDLLRLGEQKKRQNLRVREHPEKGPYVQDLSQHVVTDYKQALDLLEEGVANRITAATHNHEASSRSHAIFTIQYTQAILENNLPSEIVSKINLVDLAGSERADPHYCRDRLTEGSSINKSLVTLGIVISALAQNSQMSSSCQSINSMASEGEASLGGSVSISPSGGGGGGGASGGRRHCFIPYRDSVLTWLLKDSLGGNSKTIMIATVSPSGSSYNETLSTLRYAAHARNIVNKPRVNEDASVRLIRELRQEVDRLKSMLLSFQMQRNLSPSLSEERDGTLSDMVLQNELKVEQLTQDWSEGWRGEKQALLQQYGVDIDGDRAGVLVRSLQPHLVSLDRDVLSTGVLLHHLREGVTRIGPHRSDRPEEPQIVVQGDGSCEIVNEGGVVTLRPMAGSVCVLNDREVTEPCRLAQGSVISLGSAHRFRFNHPAEAAVLRERRRAIGAGGFREPRQIPSGSSAGGGEPQSGSVAALSPGEECAARQQVVEQQWYVETLRREIQAEQRAAESELEREQAHLQQQHVDVQQWILQEKQRLLSIAPKETQESGVQADLLPAPLLEVLSSAPQGSEDATAASVPDPPPPRLVRARKKAVQDELLRIHALRRAESRVRRKRLHLQLERIARKRHLLEAKRELQRLEQALPPGLESPGSPELGSPCGSGGQPSGNPRRHSFSVDTLSRLYPQHPPIFSHYLKRNRSTELTLNPPRTGDCFSRRWLSDECLPRERSRSCSDSRVSSGQRMAPGGRAGSSENLKQTVKEPPPAQSYQERPERKPLLTNRSLTFKTSQNPRGSLKSPQRTALQPISNEREKDTSAENPKVQKIACGDFRTPQGSSKGVGTIRKVFSRSVGPGLKMALSKVFRKPPSGMNGRRNPQQVGRTNRLHWRNISRDGGMKDGRTHRNQCALKMTVSCEELDQRTSPVDLKHRHWHSMESLMDQTSSWVERLQPGLVGWVEDEGGDDRDEGSSDCDSLLSVDSLSSAYAAVLAERLRHEEALGSESDSADSQMSRDSLAAEGSTLRPRRTRSLAPTYARVTDFPHLLAGRFRTPAVYTVLEKTNGQSTQGTPAEAYCSQNGGSNAIAGREAGIVVKPPVHKTKDEPVTKRISFPGSPGSPSSCSTREPDLQLVLTDAWSSTDAADSPRVSRECSATFRETTLFLAGNMNSSSSSSPSLISVGLSDCQNTSRSCISTTCSSADGVHVTMGGQNVKATTELSDAHSPDSETPPEPGNITRLMVDTGVDNDGRSPTRHYKISESVQKITADVQTSSHLGVEPLTETRKCLSSAEIEICHRDLTSHQPIIVHQASTGVSPMEIPSVINSFETVLCTSSQPLESCVKTQSAVHEVYTEDNALVNLDKTDKLNIVKPYKSTDAKDLSTPRDRTPLVLEAKRSELALSEHEPVHPACKSSRKRNKELTESLAGGLKIPKRSVEVTPETFRSTQIARRGVCWSDGNGNNRDEEKVPGVDEDLSPDLDHANMDARTESHPPGRKRDQAEENVALSPESNNTGSLLSSSIGQVKAVETDRESDVSTGLEKQFKKSVGIVDQRRRPEQRKTARQWDAICSAIDLRIAEVVRGHLASASLTAGDAAAGQVRSLAALWPPADAVPTGESETQVKDDGRDQTKAEVAHSQRPFVPQGETHNEMRSDTRDKICALGNDVTIRSPAKVVKATGRAPNTGETASDIPPSDDHSLSDDAGTDNSPCPHPVHLAHQPGQISSAHGPRESLETPPPCTGNDGDGVTRGETCHSTPARPSVSSKQPDRQACPAAWAWKPEPPQAQNIFPDIPTSNETANANANPDHTAIMDLGMNLSHVLHDEHIDASKTTSAVETGNHSKDGRLVSVAMTTLYDGEVHLPGPHRRASGDSVDERAFAKSLGDIPEHLANESSELKTERISENWRITKSNQRRSKSSAQTCVVNRNYHNNNPAIARRLNEHSIIASCVQNNTTDPTLGNTHITESQVPSIMTKNEILVIAALPGDPSGNTCADGDVSNSDMSTHGHTKQRNHTTMHRTGKSKRFRRSNATVHPNPSSSSDSAVRSSSDEDGEMLSRVQRSRLESTPFQSSRSRIIQTGGPNRAPNTLKGSKGFFPVETRPSQAPGVNETPARECYAKRHLSQPQQLQSNQHKERTTPYLIVSQSDYPETLQEPRMHFASSDINPFVHQWQEEQSLHKGYKNLVFGSAADLSSKSPALNGAEGHMTRCCSVDNGLNGQNSPFNSHLSTFVNHKGLSSTLSSGEDYKEQGRTASHDVSDVSCPRSSSIDDGLAGLSLNSGSSCHDVPRGLSADSALRVDEIMLLYSPEQEPSLANTAQTQRWRTLEEHGTQTECRVMKNLVVGPQRSCASTVPGRDHSRTQRHQRSRTHVPTSLRTKEDITQCPTWASMENMSAHLSQLIHSTSDLLGDVQGMRTGETLVKPSPRRTVNGSNITTPRCTLKDSTSTHSSSDIGIQTEAISSSSVKEIHQQWTSPSERPKPHEVTVVVKVIGSDSLSVSYEKGFSGLAVEKPRSDDGAWSKSDLRINTLAAKGSTDLRLLKTSHSLTSAGKPTETKMCCTTSAPSSHSKQSVADTKSGFSQTSHGFSRTTASEKTGRSSRCVEQTRYTDRASSPIVTLGANERTRSNGNQYPPCRGKRGSLVRDQDATDRIFGDVSSRKSGELASLESASQISLTESSFTSKGFQSHVDRNIKRENITNEENNNNIPSRTNRDSAKSPQQRTSTTRNGISRRSHPSAGGRRDDGCSPEVVDRHDDRGTRTPPSTEPPRGPPKYDLAEGAGISTSSSLSGARTPEDDAASTAPSECNTDVLLSAKPITGVSPPPSPPPPQHHHPRGGLLPQDLPLHNKFSHWSGIGETQRRSSTRRPNKPDPLPTDGQPPGGPSGGAGREGAEGEGLRGGKTREIERLRRDRQQVMASVRGEVSASRLTVELAEARLHYGLGETDALLRMLSPAWRDEAEPAGASPTNQEPAGASPTNQEPAGASPTNQQLCDRHRRSADWSRQEREARLQSFRRARSLSPSRHPASLQPRRQDVMDSTRVPAAAREEGRCPSEIQHLLRDYGRAREEACGEIARARERLRRRTELEKRRLQQQAATVKDEASRFCAAASSSTLCTDSSLSLSSGHTSGYVSGHTPQRRDPGGPPPPAQGPRFDDEGSKVRGRAPPCGSQGSKGPSHWVSTQDFHLESPASEFKPLLTSSPAAGAPTRQRSSSFGSASSISSTYQKVASGLLSQALLEIRLAAAGDTANLLLGKASAGWRHEGAERGIQAYHRPSCSPTVHGFLGAGELDGPLADLWDLLRQPSNCRLYHPAVRSAWARPLDGSTQLVYVLTNPSVCNLSQPRDFCCLSVASKQGAGVCVLAQQSVFEESLPRPSAEAVRGEMMPSAWCLQPITRGGLEVVRVVYLLQVDLGSPALPSSQLRAAARRHASVIAELGSLLRAARPPKRGCSLP